jgi:hypothetical protein
MAEAARWTAQAKSYSLSQMTRGQLAEIARWNAMAEFYGR